MSNLPPLPTPKVGREWEDAPLYSMEQIEAYGAACRAAALEEAVQACWDTLHHSQAEKCASAIRALKD